MGPAGQLRHINYEGGGGGVRMTLPNATVHFCFISLSTAKRKPSLWPRERDKLRKKGSWYSVGNQVNAWLGSNYCLAVPALFESAGQAAVWPVFLPPLIYMCIFPLSFPRSHLFFFCWESPLETSIILLLFQCPWVGPAVSFWLAYSPSLPLLLCRTLAAASWTIRLSLSTDLLYRKDEETVTVIAVSVWFMA